MPYNTKKTKGLLLNDDQLHKSLMEGNFDKNTKDGYIKSKFDWTGKTSIAFCKSMDTDFAIAEGGAAGPTFGPEDMNEGFSVLSIAGKGQNGRNFELLKQKVIHSSHNDRERNMQLFSDAAAELLIEVLKEREEHSNNKTISLDWEIPQDETIMLDRSTHIRSNEDKIEGLKPKAKYLLVKGNEILFRSDAKLAALSHDEVSELKNDNVTFLGILSDKEQTPIFGIDIVDEDFDEMQTSSGLRWLDTRTNAPLLSRLENELALHIMAYANWQRKSRFCTLDGAPLTLIHAGTAQKCTQCNTMYWPRQDPSMIASITSRCGNRILLAQSKRHPRKLHTVLAGFVEAGETFEAAVARETWEETGIIIDKDSVKYQGMQPWPFPQSCMIAFSATADDTQPLNIDQNELVDAKWFDKKEVMEASKVEGAVMQHHVAEAAMRANPDLPLLIPPKRVIARTLIDTWLESSV